MKLPQDFHFKYRLALSYVVCLLVCFFVFRLALWLVYSPVFESMSSGDVWQGFGRGICFDISVICLFCSPVFLLLFVPVRSARYLQTIHVLWCVLALFLLGILAADFVYFPEAKRHMADELLYVKNEIGFLLHYVWVHFWWALLLLAGLFAGSIKLGFMAINRFYKPRPVAAWKTVVAFLIVGGLLLLGLRGKVGHGKPLSMRDVHELASTSAQGTLMINGVFSAYQSLRRVESLNQNPLPKKEAISRARQMLADPSEIFPQEEYPLMRQLSDPKPPLKKNVFVILLESWTPQYIDSYSNAGYAVTPHFDKLAREGVRFSNAYAAGVRSIYGLAATFAGVPIIQGIPRFSDGLELNAITSIARMLRQRGYYTAFMQSSLRSSYQMCNMASHVFGFEESFGMEDMPHLLDYQAEQDFGYDYDLLMFAADKAKKAVQTGKPFFMFTFTGTTHTPFNQTTPAFDKYPRTTEINKYLNTLYYADYSIGQLIERAKQDGWFKDTVFVLMADHTMGQAQGRDNIYEKFRIPYVIYAPSLLKPKTVDYPVSQLDLIPTLLHLLHIPVPFNALGKNSLDHQGAHFAFITEGGSNIALITDQGFIRHNRIKALESSATPGTALYQQLETDLLSLDKSTTSLFQNNSWTKPQ